MSNILLHKVEQSNKNNMPALPHPDEPSRASPCRVCRAKTGLARPYRAMAREALPRLVTFLIAENTRANSCSPA